MTLPGILADHREEQVRAAAAEPGEILDPMVGLGRNKVKARLRGRLAIGERRMRGCGPEDGGPKRSVGQQRVSSGSNTEPPASTIRRASAASAAAVGAATGAAVITPTDSAPKSVSAVAAGGSEENFSANQASILASAFSIPPSSWTLAQPKRSSGTPAFSSWCRIMSLGTFSQPCSSSNAAATLGWVT